MVVTPFATLMAFVLWLLFTKTVKLWPHFYRHPDQMKFIPILIIFGYFHGFIKLYCLLTLHKVSEAQRVSVPMLTWLSRHHGAVDDSSG